MDDYGKRCEESEMEDEKDFGRMSRDLPLEHGRLRNATSALVDRLNLEVTVSKC